MAELSPSQIPFLLQEAGLTSGETKVYLALLRIGETSIGEIVKRSKVSTSKVYKVLDRLADKGLCSHVFTKKIKIFRPADPEKILDYLRRKEHSILETQHQIKEVIPQLKGFQLLGKSTQRAEIFEGMEGFKTVFDDIIKTLKKGDTQLVFGAGLGSDEQRYSRFFEQFHRKREAKGIRAKIIFNEDVCGKFPLQENSKLVECRYLPQTTPAAINIYSDKTTIELLGTQPVAFVITSKEVTESFRSYFSFMWRMAKSATTLNT